LRWVIARGTERQTIFREDRDREDVFDRLGGMPETGALTVDA
jgi:hypothetical protein